MTDYCMRESDGFVAPDREDITTLQAGNEIFHITAGALCERAGFFKSMFYGPASHIVKSPPRTADGAYIVQADPRSFRHIVKFCLFNTYPLLMTGESFDFSAYANLLEQARFFQVFVLGEWISSEGFRLAVNTEFTFHDGCDNGVFEATPDGIVDREYLPNKIERKKVYLCPKRFTNPGTLHEGPHKGYPLLGRCGKHCPPGDWEQVDVTTFRIVTRRLVFNTEALICRR